MSKLPRRPIDPLAPPPGSFDRVVSTARARRRRRGLVVSSSAAVLAIVASAAFALGSSLGVRDRFISPITEPSGDNSPLTSSTQASKTPSPKGSKAHSTTAGAAASATQTPVSYLRGRAVDAAGHPISGLYVQPGAVGHVTYDTNGHVAGRTDEHGYFKIGCTRSPVLLATWRLDHGLDQTIVGGDWAATFVGGSDTNPVVPACGTTVHRVVMSPGASVTGTVHATSSCSDDQTFPLWLWLHGDRERTVRLKGLHEGDTFTFSGLPAGSHTLGANGLTTGMSISSGGSIHQDATFSCDPETSPGGTGGSTGTAGPGGTGDPSDSPEPDPTPEPTPHPTPSSSPSSSGWQSGSAQPVSPSTSRSAAE